MVNHIYPSELQLNKTNVSDTEASLLDFCLRQEYRYHKLHKAFSDKDIDIINFVRRSQNFIGGILT